MFVAINLPEDIKADLQAEIAKIRGQYGSEARFLSPENWHLTIVFLAYQSDDGIDKINQALAETARSCAAPTIRFEKIVYGPVGRTPRMIWLTADNRTSKELADIKNTLEQKLYEKGVNFKQEYREFHGHLTLARFEATARRELPPLEAPFNRQFLAGTLDLMESHLKRTGAEYDILNKCVLKNQL